MKISLCIPLYNEEKIIRDTAESVSRYMKERFTDGYEVLFVNDGSKDASLEILSEINDPNIRVLTYPENKGKGYAVRVGMLKAKGEIVIFTDCDLAYGLDIVGEFYDEMIKNPEYGAVIGSRSLHPEGYFGYTFGRKLISKAYLRVLAVYGGLRLSDSQSGIKAFRRELAQKVFSEARVDRFAFDFEIILLTRYFGGIIREYPVRIINHRPSTIRFFKDSARMLRDIGKIKKRIRRMKKEKREKSR